MRGLGGGHRYRDALRTARPPRQRFTASPPPHRSGSPPPSASCAAAASTCPPSSRRRWASSTCASRRGSARPPATRPPSNRMTSRRTSRPSASRSTRQRTPTSPTPRRRRRRRRLRSFPARTRHETTAPGASPLSSSHEPRGVKLSQVAQQRARAPGDDALHRAMRSLVAIEVRDLDVPPAEHGADCSLLRLVVDSFLRGRLHVAGLARLRFLRLTSTI